MGTLNVKKKREQALTKKRMTRKQYATNEQRERVVVVKINLGTEEWPRDFIVFSTVFLFSFFSLPMYASQSTQVLGDILLIVLSVKRYVARELMRERH